MSEPQSFEPLVMSPVAQGHCIKFPHRVIVKAPSLLPMQYRLTDLETELGVSARLIRTWLHCGLPHVRDTTGHIWIEGRALAAWVKAHHKSSTTRTPLSPSEAFCVGCRTVVSLENPTPLRHGRRTLLRGTCPQCGRTICRGVRRD